MSPHFRGFLPVDFEGIEGTTWRSREGFGGAVTHILNHDTSLRFQSWSVPRKQEMHIADRNHYGKPSSPRRGEEFAKLFVYTYDPKLRYGMYVESAPDDARYLHWKKLRDNSETQETLRQLMLRTPLKEEVNFESDRNPKWSFCSQDGQLLWRDSPDEDYRTAEWEKFGELFRQKIGRLPLPKARAEWVDLHIFSEMPRDAAIKIKDGITAQVCDFLGKLVPLYRKIIM